MSDVTLSKALSRLLRHAAQQEGVSITADGWVRVSDALRWANSGKGGGRFNEATLRAVVADNGKQRFSLRDGRNGLEIRANQGHSMSGITVDMVELDAATCPALAVHGTYFKAWAAIRDGGLSKMRRQHIHLARKLPGASGVISGMRSSCELMVWVDVRRAITAGVKFFESSNGVILTEGVDGVLPPAFFAKAVDRSGHPVPLAPPPSATAAAASTAAATAATAAASPRGYNQYCPQTHTNDMSSTPSSSAEVTHTQKQQPTDAELGKALASLRVSGGTPLAETGTTELQNA
mmetsp:Transcript_29169/g.71668  ORF Transcript_29169/g.71668 Transcript_29169/m.71668 type:complete len:292 (-) Transcript_29169:455-1330(-)